MSLIYTTPIAQSQKSASASTSLKRRNSIYIGGKADAKSRTKLEQWGVSHILNMTPQKDSSVQAGVPNYFENKRRFTYKRIAVYDASTTNLKSYAPEIVAFISKGLNYGSVLVHCQRGVSRSTTAVLFYLMHEAGMALEEALEVCRRRRDCVNPIPAFLSQLKEYELECTREGLIMQNDDGADQKAVGAMAGNLKGKRKAIGPSRGPMPVSNPTDDDHDGGTSKKKRRAIGPSRGPVPKQRVIGPCRPPSLPVSDGPNKDADGKADTEANADAAKEKLNE